MAEREKRYDNDIIAALAKHTITRLWIIIILLIVLLFGTNAAWIYYESQFETIEMSQEVEQDADGNGTNSFIGGDYYGTAESENDSKTQG